MAFMTTCLKCRKITSPKLSARFPARRRFGILVSTMLRQSFTDFIFATNTDGSGKATSYVGCARHARPDPDEALSESNRLGC